MKTKICCFCNINYINFGSTKLLEAYVPKYKNYAYRFRRKRIFFHLDCVQWSLGFLRKEYKDKDTYVCHLYDSTCNKLCTICNRNNPTIKGENQNQYYHYHCALAKNIPISKSKYVDFVDYFNEQRNIIDIEKSLEIKVKSDPNTNTCEITSKKLSATPTSICEMNYACKAEPLLLETSESKKKVLNIFYQSNRENMKKKL